MALYELNQYTVIDRVRASTCKTLACPPLSLSLSQLTYILTQHFKSRNPIVFVAAAGLPAPRRLATAPTRHYPASLTAPPP